MKVETKGGLKMNEGVKISNSNIRSNVKEIADLRKSVL